MPQQTNLPKSVSSRNPVGRFLFGDQDGHVCDLTPLILDGAKLTVLFIQVCRDWHITGHLNDKVYVRLRRQCISWEQAGLVEITRNAVCSSSVDVAERPGLFVRAKPGIPMNRPYLIKKMQNSKSSANENSRPQTRYHDPAKDGVLQITHLLSTEETAAKMNAREPTQRQKTVSGIPWTDRMSKHRKLALRVISTITDASLFQRVTNSKGEKVINPELKRKLGIAHQCFQDWLEDTAHKKIVLRKRNAVYGEDPYLILNCRNRFNDVGRAIANEITYKDCIQNSLKRFNTGVLLTLTTDPAIWMSPNGAEVPRHIKDGKKTYHFSTIGKGLSLIAANRHESTAWRKWYEAECYRHDGYRIPYIRVVEFQKNGLIHTHVLLFGIEWDTPWQEFAKTWGEKYGQGFMNKAYKVVNDGGVWKWDNASEQPADTKGRDPADYLMKYLKKAQHLPQVTCPHCGLVQYAAGGSVCEQCKTKIPPAYDGRFLYWVCGKRFFTASTELKTFDADEEVAEWEERQRKKIYGPDYEFLGVVDNTAVDPFIRDDRIRRRPAITLDTLRIYPAVPDEFKVRWKFDDEYTPSVFLPPEETPDQGCECLIPDTQTEYEKMLAEERRLMRERRERLKRNSEERSG